MAAVTAQSVGHCSARQKAIDVFVKDLLVTIDDAIMRHDRRIGGNMVAFDIPDSFPFVGITRVDAQRVVFSAVMRSLEERGFGVRMLMTDKVTTLFIGWNSQMSTSELKALDQYISDHRVTKPPKSAEEFVKERQSRAAPVFAPPAGEGY